MKKFFAFAVLALTVGFFASCGAGSSNKYKQGDPAPDVNYDKCTVNGIPYDNEHSCCWEETITGKAMGITASETTYSWCTEFEEVAAMEQAMWAVAQGNSAYGIGASYSYKKAPQFKDSESCLANNDKQK